jgi:hypothetical protein
MTIQSECSLRSSRWLVWPIPLLIAFNVPSAYAVWNISIADAPATVIRGADLYSTTVNQRVATDDMVESGATGILLLQDDTGNVMALGPGTRILIEPNARVALLTGWVKIAHECTASACLAPAVETERGALEIGDHAAAIVAAVSAPDPVTEMFSESGIQKLEVPTNSTSTPDSAVLAEGQFVSIASNKHFDLRPRPSAAFLSGMPIAFGDALTRVATTGKLRDDLPAPLRPVSFDDVAIWLMSGLPARRQPGNSFADRFRPRLADAGFDQQVEQNLSALPEWQGVLPAPRPKPVIELAKKSTIVKSEPGGGTERVRQAGSDASAQNPPGPPKDSGNWFSRLFNGWHK